MIWTKSTQFSPKMTKIVPKFFYLELLPCFNAFGNLNRVTLPPTKLKTYIKLPNFTGKALHQSLKKCLNSEKAPNLVILPDKPLINLYDTVQQGVIW